MAVAGFGPKRERNRLAQLYAALSDGELQQLASETESLTDEARAALALEMSRRNIPAETAGEAEDSPPGGRAKLRDLLTIRQFRDLPEALLAKSVLDSAGIECFLGDDNLIRMDWLWSNLLGGIKLRVRQEDALEASRLLEGEPRKANRTSRKKGKGPTLKNDPSLWLPSILPSRLRAGRASPSRLRVKGWGTRSPLKSRASVGITIQRA